MAKDSLPRLRAAPISPPFRIVLVEPEIPQNTGNIARLAAATQSPLHLIGQLGFRIDEKSVRRAGIDYWHLVDLHQHISLEHFQHNHPHARLCMFSAAGKFDYFSATFQPGDALVFGKESVGLDQSLLEKHKSTTFAIPTMGAIRSLNLANSVAIVLYEALRQVGAFSSVTPKWDAARSYPEPRRN